MLCEALRRLARIAKLETYRYIGFGSTFFSDFTLFHKSLRITDNISMEHDTQNRDRFEFNKPYNCIKIEYGESSAILPGLEWNAKTIAWLDYDCKLKSGVLADAAFVASNAPSGSVLIVSVNVEPDKLHERLRLLNNKVGEQRVPQGWSNNKLGGWGTAIACRRIIDNEITETIQNRNGIRSGDDKFVYKQLFNFRYSDGAKMLTVGGIIFEKNHEELVSKCDFEDFDFIKTGEDFYSIEVPSLTIKEIKYLDTKLPCADVTSIRAHAIPPIDIKRYSRIYRYFPAFVDAEIG
jgi:hypothetical protein